MEVAENKKLLVPELRFKEFDGEWRLNQIKGWDVLVIDGDRGTNYPSGDDFSDDGFCLFLNAKNVTKSGFAFDELMFITEEKDNLLRKGKLVRNDIVLTTRGSVGHIAHYTDDVAFNDMRVNSGMVLLRVGNGDVLPEFLYTSFFANSIDRQVKVISFGSAQPQLTVKEINRIKLSVPSIPEQKKIADFLSAVDARIQHLGRKKELLEQYKKGVMQKLFNFPLSRGDKGVCKEGSDKNEHTPSPSQEGRLRFKRPDGTNYPDWEEKRLGEIGKTYNGLTGKTKEDFGEGAPFVTYKQIFDNSKIDTAKFDHVDIQPNEKQSRVNYGDVFFTTSSETRLEVGFASVLLDKVEELYLNSFCFGYRVNSFDQFLPEYARYLFRNEGFRKDITRLGQGSTRYNMSKNEMKKLFVSLPSKEEQQKIADFLSVLDKKIEAVSTQIAKTQQFKKGLLQKMFV